MKYLITGGAGFIGSHLSEHILNRGEAVQVIDDLSTGSFENIAHLKGRERFQYSIGTILNIPLTAELVDQCDVIIHLAAAVGVRLIVESPVRTIETNVRGTEAILELAAKKKKRTLVASTSEVYGKSNKFPFSEDDDLVMGPPTKGRWSYACSKAIDEFLALAYWKERQVPVSIARLFNTVGPRQVGRYGMVLPNFVEQSLRGDPITVYGDGGQSRCFCHVRDVVEALRRAATAPEAVGEVFNIGSDQEVTILELARRVRELAGSGSEIVLVPYEKAYESGFEDMRRRVPSLAKAARLLGYRPRFGLDDMIRDVIQDRRAKLESAG